MKKRISALVIAMSVFMCSSTFAFAAESDIVPYDACQHEFSLCNQVGSPYRENMGPHTYLYGKDENGNEMFKNDCQLSAVYVNCQYLCTKCRIVKPGGIQHRHMIGFEHSKTHN